MNLDCHSAKFHAEKASHLSDDLTVVILPKSSTITTLEWHSDDQGSLMESMVGKSWIYVFWSD